MFDLKTIATAALTAIIVVLATSVLVGDNQSVGGYTRFPNSDVLVKSLELDNGAATTSLVTDKVCQTVTTAAGNTIYVSWTGPGKLSTSSVSCL